MWAILRPKYFYSLSDSKVCALNDMHDQHRQGRTMHGVLWIHVTIKWRHQTSDAHHEIVDSTFQISGD
jgi:hypothetical protein